MGGKPRTIISERGKLYREAVLAMTLPPGIDGDLVVVIDGHPPTLRKYDCDNFFKAPLDALTHAGFWADDSVIVDLRFRKRPKESPGRLRFQVAACPRQNCK